MTGQEALDDLPGPWCPAQLPNSLHTPAHAPAAPGSAPVVPFTTKGGVSFTFNPQPRDQAAAQALCNTQGGHLAMYTSQAEQGEVELGMGAAVSGAALQLTSCAAAAEWHTAARSVEPHHLRGISAAHARSFCNRNPCQQLQVASVCSHTATAIVYATAVLLPMIEQELASSVQGMHSWHLTQQLHAVSCQWLASLAPA